MTEVTVGCYIAHSQGDTAGVKLLTEEEKRQSMPTRKGLVREQALPQLRAGKLDHTKHSRNFSKKRNERFSVEGARAPKAQKTGR